MTRRKKKYNFQKQGEQQGERNELCMQKSESLIKPENNYKSAEKGRGELEITRTPGRKWAKGGVNQGKTLATRIGPKQQPTILCNFGGGGLRSPRVFLSSFLFCTCVYTGISLWICVYTVYTRMEREREKENGVLSISCVYPIC